MSQAKPRERHQDSTPQLDRAGRRQAERRAAPTAAIVHEAIRQEGEEEINRATSALAWSGLAAGLSMGFSLAAQGLILTHLPAADWSPLLYRLGYSVGFLIVVLGRQQLFTESTLTGILPLLVHRDLSTLLKVGRVWAVVLAANIFGAMLFAAAAAYTGIFSPEIRQAFTEIGLGAAKPSFVTILLTGIVAGWLIALMVWLLPFAEVGRIWIIIIITYLVGLAEFSHIIAGSLEVLYVVATGALSWQHFLGGYFIPTLIGNVIGGVSLVAAINHAQVIAGNHKED